jgi:hypothetical protein
MKRANCRVEVRSFFFGIYLGSCNADSPEKLEWTSTQRDWIEWKAAYLRTNLKYACVLTETKNEYGTVLGFKINRRKGRGRIYSKWLRTQKKSKAITPKIRFFSHPMGMTALILDLGHCTEDCISIDMSQYSTHELTLLQDALKENMQLSCEITKDLHLVFTEENLDKLWDMIKNTIPRIEYAQKKFAPLLSRSI